MGWKFAPPVVLALALTAAPALADLNTGLVAYYPFNGNANDASGHGNNGTPNGTMALTTDRFGNTNSAYEFDGSDSWISVPASGSLDSPHTAITESAWLMLYGPSKVGQGTWDPVFTKSATTENVFMYNFQIAPQWFGGEFNNWFNGDHTGYAFSLNQWYLVTMTYDGAEVRFYVNGSAVDSTAATFTMNSDGRPLTIGADVPGILEVFYGKLDDVRIYNRALSADEVQTLYAVTASVAPADPRLGVRISSVVPNPASNRCDVQFSLASAADVLLEILDVNGRTIRTLARGARAAGAQSVRWDGRDARGRRVGAGIYFCRLSMGKQVATARMVRL